jgi:hypothetical protein
MEGRAMGFFNFVDWLDITKDVAVDSINNLKPDQQDWNERTAAAGDMDGRQDAAQDYSRGQVNQYVMAHQDADVSRSYAERFSYQDAQEAAAEAEKVPNIPIGSPLQVAASIFFTPSEIALEPSDKGSFWATGRDAYENAYVPAYRQEAIQAFDQQLENRLQPDPDLWRDATKQEVNMSPVFPDHSPSAAPDATPPPPPTIDNSGSSAWGDSGGGGTSSAGSSDSGQ